MTTAMFGHYRLDGLLGRGGMGEVYRAFDTEQERVVALKVLPASLSGDDEYRQRFRREARLASQLTDPHIVPIHRHGEIDGQLYLDMRLVDGDNLAAVLRAEGPLHPQPAVLLVEQVASALDAAHDAGLIHRDVKPSNVFLTRPARPGAQRFAYLGDFGIARALGSSTDSVHTATGSALGTLDYMAPERFLGRPLDAGVDVYALACLLHECLTGRKPFPGDELPALMHAHLSLPPPRPSALVPVPFGLDSVVERGMAKDPRYRHRSAGELAGHARAAITVPMMPPPAGTDATPTVLGDGTAVGLRPWDGREFGTGPTRTSSSQPQWLPSQPQPPVSQRPSQQFPQSQRTAQPEESQQSQSQRPAQQEESQRQPAQPEKSQQSRSQRPAQQEESQRRPSQPESLPQPALQPPPPQPRPEPRAQQPVPSPDAPTGYGRSGVADLLAVLTVAAFTTAVAAVDVIYDLANGPEKVVLGTLGAAAAGGLLRLLLPAQRPLLRIGISALAGALAVGGALGFYSRVGTRISIGGLVVAGLAIVVILGARVMTKPESGARRRAASVADAIMMVVLLALLPGLVTIGIVDNPDGFETILFAALAVAFSVLRLVARPRRDRVLGVAAALCVAAAATVAVGAFVYGDDPFGEGYGIFVLLGLLAAGAYAVALLVALRRDRDPASPR